MEIEKFIKAKEIDETVEWIEFIIDGIDRYNLTQPQKITLADNLINLYRNSYHPDFKKTISNCLQNLLDNAMSDFKKL